ncbi:helix-turn-helix domain-containing protein [Streptomyces sp. NBC_01483]|uniref:helix-turn-helix domain-containing protein n=1 Tax=Streptomyces sp. NBC_01483 TaxID=2903883 RepID=UPI002E31635E|nr:helix-turn-helix domain-containing protein [Streptomyces sp. NBC_01483]
MRYVHPGIELGSVRMTETRAGAAPPAGWSTGPVCLLGLVCDAPLTMGQAPDDTLLHPGDLVVWTPDYPPHPAASAREKPFRLLTLHVPRQALPVPGWQLRALVRQPVPADRGPAAVLARFMEEIATQAETFQVRSAGRLGDAALDLAAAFVTSATGPARSRRTELVEDIKAYIRRHIYDPALSPATIARAHHISLRYQQCLFQQNKETVGGFLRAERLERCRADLSDPAFADHSVGEIRARWGFEDAAVFCRAFKKAYGTSPVRYRR